MTLFFHLLGRLPLRLLHAIGAMLGLLVWIFSARYRRMLDTNLARGLGRKPTPGEHFSAIVEPGKGVIEHAWLWTRPVEQLKAKVVSIEGWDAVLAAHATKRGIVFITPHLGCPEIGGLYFSQSLGPLTALFRPPRKTILAPLMESGRNRGRMRAVPANLSGVRALLKCIRAGEAIGILPDQVPQAGEGVWTPFFGTPAYTMTLAARLAGTGGSTAFSSFAKRLPGGRGYHLSFSPLDLPDAPLPERVAALNAALEKIILSCPGQYLWGYNRYKCPAGVPGPEQQETSA